MQARKLPADLARVASFVAVVCAVLFFVSGCRRGNEAAKSASRQPASFKIQGKVLKPDSADHSGILVYCAGTSYLAYTDEQGRYTISGVPEGKYRVLSQHSDYKPLFLGEVSLAQGVADPSVPVSLPPKTLERKLTPREQAERILCSVMGQALLSDQPTAEGIVVRAVGTDFRTVTGADGSYQLLRLDPGQYTLVFEKPGYKSRRLPIRLVSGDLVFPEPIVLERLKPKEPERILTGTVTLLDPEGNPMDDYSGVLVYLEGTTRVALPGPGGAFKFDNLSPARYVVTAMAPGFFSRDRVEADLTDAAKVEVSLTLQSLEQPTSAPATLTGRVLKDDPADTLIGTLVGLVEIGATVMTDAGGNYVFSDIPPGTYTLVAQADGYLPGAIEGLDVPEGKEVRAPDLTLEKRLDYPRVIFTSPADGESGVIVRDIVPVTIRFSKKMHPESLRAAFSIQPPVDYRLYAGREHSLSDFDRLYIELLGYGGANPLHFGTRYTITIGTAARDFENLALQEPYRFSFQTAGASIIATRPPDGAKDVYVDPALYRVAIFFNAPLDPKTVTPNKLRISPSLGSNVELQLINDPGSGWSHILVSALWRRGVRYRVTVSGNIRTADGSRISNLPYTFSFTTARGRAMEAPPGRIRPRP